MLRASTGIGELDNALEGGLPRGSTLLLVGNPGTGKTVFSTQFLQAGCKSGEKGMYISFSESKEDYFVNVEHLGIDMKAFEDDNSFQFLDFTTIKESDMGAIIDLMIKSIIDFKPKRLVLDSLTTILRYLGSESVRSFLSSTLHKTVKKDGITTILIGELPYGENKLGFGIEEFVSDSVITLKHYHDLGDKRQILIDKMRGTNLQQYSMEYTISKKRQGIDIITLPNKSDIRSFSKEKLTTGIDGLDKMLRGGVYKQSITLVQGSEGIGKTTASLHFAVKNALLGKKSLYISTEEPTGHIIRMLENMGFDYNSIRKNFLLESIIPESMTPLRYYQIIKDMFEEHRPDILVIDSKTAIHQVMKSNDFRELIRYIQLLCKSNNVTTYLTSVSDPNHGITQGGVSSFADNILQMRYVETEQELRGEIMVLKARASEHEKKIVPFKITNNGIVISI